MTAPLNLRLAAVSVAYCAKSGACEPEDVDTLVTLAQQQLPAADPLHRAITGFATQYQMCRHDPEALAMQGRMLMAHVEADQAPPPSQRADIDG